MAKKGDIVSHGARLVSVFYQILSACNLVFCRSGKAKDPLDCSGLRQRVTVFNARVVSQSNVVLDFMSKVVVKVSCNALFPIVVAHVVASGKDPCGVHLDSTDGRVTKIISMKLSNIIKDLRGTISPYRIRDSFDITNNCRPSKFKDTVVINIVDVSIDRRAGTPKIRFDQSYCSGLPSWHKDMSVEFFACRG